MKRRKGGKKKAAGQIPPHNRAKWVSFPLAINGVGPPWCSQIQIMLCAVVYIYIDRDLELVPCALL